MKHDIHLEGYVYGLRPIELDDAGFIVQVRTPERTRYMHAIERTVEAQQAFLEQYLLRPNEYYFVIQSSHDHKREGLTGLLDFDDTSHSAQWGRLVLRPGSLAAADTALLMLRLAFDIFLLKEVWAVMLADNAPMKAYVKSLGFLIQEFVSVPLENKVHDGLKIVLTKDRWRGYEKDVAEAARAVAERLHPVQQGQPDLHVQTF